MALADPEAGLDPQHISLRDFVRETWEIIEPGIPLSDDWALGAMCEFLQAWCLRQFCHGVMAVAPGMSKSLLSDVFAPAWVWAREPSHKWLSVSYDADLTLRDAGKTKAIVESDAYQAAYPDMRLMAGSKAMHRLWTTRRGLRFSTSIGGKGIGWHMNSAVLDDPLKPQNVLGRSLDPVDYERVETFHDKVLPSRVASSESGLPFGSMLVAQRLSERDLSGVLQTRSGYEALVLPMRYVPRAFWCQSPWTLKLEQRAVDGELLAPTRQTHTEAAVRRLEISLGHDAEAQLQQNPIPRTGGLMREEWLRWEWVDMPWQGLWIQVWDLAAKGTDLQNHSAVHGSLWVAKKVSQARELLTSIHDRETTGKVGETRVVQVPDAERYHLIEDVWGVWPFEETLRQMWEAQQRPNWYRAQRKLVEEKAAGIQAIQVLTGGWRDASGQVRKIPGIIATTPKEDKLDRFRPVVPPAAEAGLILLPAWTPDRDAPGGKHGPDAWRKELLSFPHGRRNDRVDTTSDALRHFTDGGVGRRESILRAAAVARGGAY